MTLGEATHQKLGKPQGGPGRTVVRRSEAASEAMSDEATLARHAQTDCGATDLLGQALARENMARAWKRVKANKGRAGVDGRTVQETGDYLKTAWPDIRRRLLDGSYRPEPVRRVDIPKPDGGVRELGDRGEAVTVRACRRASIHDHRVPKGHAACIMVSIRPSN